MGARLRMSAERFLEHADARREVSDGQRRNYRQKWSKLRDQFDGVQIGAIDAEFLSSLRDKRSTAVAKNGNFIKPATLKKDLDFVRLVLRYAKEYEKSIPDIPQFPSFRGKRWAITPSPRPFLDLAQWRKLRAMAKERAGERDLNPRTKRQRTELYCFLLLCVGAALRVEEAYSVRWMDCTLSRLSGPRKEQVLRMMVLGKHSVGGEREPAHGLYGAVSAYQLLKKERPDAKAEERLFLEEHREGMKQLLEAAGLRRTPDGRTRDAKSLRQTGISLRLELGNNLDYRDIAKWARTSPAMIAQFYDQCHPLNSVERIAGFRRGSHKRASKKKSATKRMDVGS